MLSFYKDENYVIILISALSYLNFYKYLAAKRYNVLPKVYLEMCFLNIYIASLFPFLFNDLKMFDNFCV